MYRTVGEFVSALERSGELRRVAAQVSPLQEIAAITDRVSGSAAPNPGSETSRRNDPRFAHLGGPALLFENVEGSEIPVLINAYGSYRRAEMALGCGNDQRGFEAIADRLAELVKPQPPRGLGEAVRKLRSLAPLLRTPPREVRTGACQQVVVTDPDLRRLPLLRCWPLDGDLAGVGWPAGVNTDVPGVDGSPEFARGFRGRYVTFAGVHTIHADEAGDARPASHNIGMYRVQMLGPRHMAMHWHMHHDGAAHWRSWTRLGRRMPVAIALGGESVLPYAATAPLPPGLSELLLAGLLHGRGIELVGARTVPLRVPANAEIVIEGYVSHEAGGIGWDPRQTREPLGPGAAVEGPFGDHTGFYSMPDRYPVLEVTAVTHRRNPVFPATIVGLPPQEDYYLGKATERIFLPLLRTLIPDIEDYDLPLFGAFHNAAFVKVRKAYPLHARRVMHAIWGAGQMSWTKNIVVVDDADPHDHAGVLDAVARRCGPARDIERVHGPLDILDHAAPRLASGTKIGFDATARVPGEDIDGEPLAPEPPAPTSEASRALLARVGAIAGVVEAALPVRGWLFVRARKQAAGDGRRVIEALRHALPLPPYVIVVGESVSLSTLDEPLFHWCANADAGRDGVLLPGPTLAFDATPKVPGDEHAGQGVREWPPILSFDDATLALIDRRWGEYALPPAPARAGFVSPSDRGLDG